MGQVEILFKVGDRVRLITKKYGDYYTNPIWGGKNGKITGTVIMARPPRGGLLNIEVKWDNGQKNKYADSDLSYGETDWDL
jgi:hypothetical protein